MLDTHKAESLQKKLTSLLAEVQEVLDQSDNQTKLDGFLVDLLGPVLRESDAFSRLELIRELATPETAQRTLDVAAGLRRVKDSHLLQYLDNAQVAKSYILNHESVGQNNEWRHALQAILNLESHAQAELFERVQHYAGQATVRGYPCENIK